MATAATAPGTDRYLADFVRFEKESSRGPGAWLAPRRRAAIARFAEIGFPTTKQEAWRYTSVAPLAQQGFAVPAPVPSAAPSACDLDRLTFGDWALARLVLVDGRSSASLSRADGLPGGARLASLAEALESDRPLVEPHLGRLADAGGHAFSSLNTAFLRDGAFLHLPAGAIVDGAVHVIHVATAADPSRAFVTHPRTLIVAGEGSQATIVESYLGFGDGSCFTNAVTEVVSGPGSVLDHYRVQREGSGAFHVASTHVRLERGAAFTSHALALGGRLSRNDVVAVLAGEGADCTLNGLYVVHGTRHVDNHTTVDHAAPHGSSRQLYKGVLDGRARGVFDGTVIVRPDAQKTDSRQENRNLILSPEALMNTKPTLQINADDVKCSHAATIGQIDEQSLFYLRSRAIDPETARTIMIHAFVSDIIRRVRLEPLRVGLDCLLITDLPAAGAPGRAS